MIWNVNLLRKVWLENVRRVGFDPVEEVVSSNVAFGTNLFCHRLTGSAGARLLCISSSCLSDKYVNF